MWSLSRTSRAALVVVALGGVVLVGCGKSAKEKETESNLKHLALLYGRYIAAHQGRPPRGEREFKQFIHKLDDNTLRSLNLERAALDKLFESERDGEPYVIRYGVPLGAPGPQGAPVIGYEQAGKGGKRYVAYATGQVEEISAGRLKELVPDAK